MQVAQEQTDARVSTILMRALLEAVEASGTPIETFLSKAGLAAQQYETDYGWVELSELDRLIGLAVEVTGDTAFGLHWSERSPMMKFDVLATATAYAPTLREALQCVLRFQTLLCEQPELTLIERADSVQLRLAPLAKTALTARVRSEVGISCLVRLMRHVGAPAAAVRQVAFAHPAPAYAAEYVRMFGTCVRFDQPCSAIEFDAGWLDQRVHHANVELHRLLATQAQEVMTRVHVRESVADALRDFMRSAWPRLPEMREAARALATSERSLRRRLGEAGSSYSAILDETRMVLALEQLMDLTLSIGMVATQVGFTNTAAFSRAFKRWTGKTPAAYRNARRRPSAACGVADPSADGLLTQR